jgi:glycosyltransferase involved in cell wall biosynthesis
MSEPTVAVVVPTYCRPHLLPRLIDGLERQTLPLEDFEVVIVDNASPDDTSERLAKLAAASPLRLRHLVEHQRGPAAARNTGWRATRAPLLAFIDDDCDPEPGWLAAGVDALLADDRLGVVQGCTRMPAGTKLGDWTLRREVDGPTPFFEGLNIFYRRAAVEQTDGFDEEIGNYGEDCALGWAVLEAGWERGFAPGAVVYHDAEERGVRYHLWTGVRERYIALLAKRHPGFRREAFWRPWALRWENAAFSVAVVGLVLAPWRRATLLLVLPYLRFLRIQLPARGHPNRARWLAERIAIDASQFIGMRIGNVRYRAGIV